MECSVCYQKITIDNSSELDCEHPLCLQCLLQMSNSCCPICRNDLSSKNVDLTPYLNYIDFRKEEYRVQRMSPFIRCWFGLLIFFQIGIALNFILQTISLNIFQAIGDREDVLAQAFLGICYFVWGIIIPTTVLGCYIYDFRNRYCLRLEDVNEWDIEDQLGYDPEEDSD